MPKYLIQFMVANEINKEFYDAVSICKLKVVLLKIDKNIEFKTTINFIIEAVNYFEANHLANEDLSLVDKRFWKNA